MEDFRGVMMGYSHSSPSYRVHNPATRRITTCVHVKFYEAVPSFGTSHNADSSADVFFDVDDDSPPLSYPRPLILSRITRVWFPPCLSQTDLHVFAGRLLALRIVSLMCPQSHACVLLTHARVTSPSTWRTSFVALHDISTMAAHPRHESTEGPVAHVALVSACVCVEPTSYHAALVSPQ
jgi:hypothetical protein